MPRTRRAAAFTLIEVLVAITIFALTAIVLGSAYVNVLTSYSVVAKANLTNEDVAFARSIILAEPDRKVIEEGGDFESTNSRHVKWSATIESTTINDLFTVTYVCEITSPAQVEPQRTTQTFTVLRPTWSDPAERSKLLEDAKNRIASYRSRPGRPTLRALQPFTVNVPQAAHALFESALVPPATKRTVVEALTKAAPELSGEVKRLLALLAMGVPLNIGGWGPREGVAALVFGAAGLGAALGLTTAVVYGVLALVASLPGAGVLLFRSRAPRTQGAAA